MTGKNGGRTRRRVQLSAEGIAREAMALINDEGLDGFSYRKLAKRLGCEAMSLYHYYPSKSHLFDALVDICVNETPVPPKTLPPRERMRLFCHGMRTTALKYPGFVRFWITHRLNHRNALDWMNRAVEVFIEAGLPTERAALIFRAFSNYLMGALLDEASGYSRGPSAVEPVPNEEARHDFPAIMALGNYFGREYHLAMFETGLNVLLDWFEDEIDAAPNPKTTRKRA